MADDDAQTLAQRSADAMWAADRATRALGMKIESVAPGRSVLSMTVRADMIGPGGQCSRGAMFLLADSALAFAVNSRGHRVVLQSCDVVFDGAVGLGEELVADARERHLFERKGICDVRVTTRAGRVLAEFRGHSHRLKGRLVA